MKFQLFPLGVQVCWESCFLWNVVIFLQLRGCCQRHRGCGVGLASGLNGAWFPSEALMTFPGHRNPVGVWCREGKAALWEEGGVPRSPSSFHGQRQNPADLETGQVVGEAVCTIGFHSAYVASRMCFALALGTGHWVKRVVSGLHRASIGLASTTHTP